MDITTLAVIGAVLYFFVFGAGFVFRPELSSRLGLKWIDRSGRTEIRCYYGAVSWAIGAFLIYLLANDLSVEALTGVLFLAGAVLTMRVIGTAIDGGWADPYSKVAIPTEAAFVGGLVLVRIFG